jgi:hypothetical protein
MVSTPQYILRKSFNNPPEILKFPTPSFASSLSSRSSHFCLNASRSDTSCRYPFADPEHGVMLTYLYILRTTAHSRNMVSIYHTSAGSVNSADKQKRLGRADVVLESMPWDWRIPRKVEASEMNVMKCEWGKGGGI